MPQNQIKKTPVHELKFIITNNKACQIIQWLKRACEPDSEYAAGTVSSVYYDTRYWKFMGEKINSDYLKTKVRLRWYSDITNTKFYDVSFAEAKFKIGGRREKIRIKTPFTGKMLSLLPLENMDLQKIPRLLMSKEVVINENIFPVFQISYKRLRFIEPSTGSRICIDYDISAPRVNSYMLSYFNPFTLQTAVFEIKGKENELPPSLYPLTDLGLKKSAFSKYSTCYQKILRSHF